MNNLPEQFHYYYWGPLLWSSKIPLPICDEFLRRGQELTIPLNENLASIIEDVKTFTKQEDRKFLVDILHPYLQLYLEFSKKWYQKENVEMPELELMKYWINFQKANEYNPEHTHGGDFSFVFYVNIPENLREENKNYTGTSAGPGAITFRYGEDNDWAASTQSFIPEKGDLFIFPAKLAHTVFPFKCEGERISISGNFRIVRD